jgi:nucleotide-binding universal stress UspA family protein
MNNKVLVPIDFTDVTENALRFALDIAKLLDTGISLLHVIAKNSEHAEAEASLNQLISKYNDQGTDLKAVVRLGKVIEVIGETATETESAVVIMGTHGMRGLQFLFGSAALKTVTNSDVPFIITQARLRKDEKIDDIVVPIDLAKEDKQIFEIVVRISTILGARVHLYASRYSDEFTNNRVQRNLIFAVKYFKEANVEITVNHAERPNNFDDQLVAFANLNEADLIAIVNQRDDGMIKLLGSNFEQSIITNRAGIPVLMINARPTTTVSDIFRTFR